MDKKVLEMMDILNITRLQLIENFSDTDIEFTEEEVISLIDLKEELSRTVGKIIDCAQINSN